jgi:ubiquitin C-terminal hydrolase
MEVTKVHKLLLLHLKQFIVDVSLDYTTITYCNNQSSMEFAEGILVDDNDGVFSEFFSDNCSVTRTPFGFDRKQSLSSKYGLQNVVYHVRSLARFGHYTANAKWQMNDGNAEWFLSNDDNVTKIYFMEATEQSSTTTYMVLYEME